MNGATNTVKGNWAFELMGYKRVLWQLTLSLVHPSEGIVEIIDTAHLTAKARRIGADTKMSAEQIEADIAACYAKAQEIIDLGF